MITTMNKVYCTEQCRASNYGLVVSHGLAVKGFGLF